MDFCVRLNFRYTSQKERTMHFFKALGFAMMVNSLALADINFDAQTHSCHGHSEPVFNLSLQAIQSNFVGPPDYYAGNNGLPIVGSTIPTVISVEAERHSDDVHLHIKPFSFTLTATGFMISQNVLPRDFAPTNARWVDFDAGIGIEGHVYRDGSVRFSGPNDAPLAAGTYNVLKSKVAYGTELHPHHAEGFFDHDNQLVRNENFPISQGLTNLGGMPGSINNNTDYAEYYGMTFFDGKIYTSTTDNSFDNSATPIAVFNKVNKHGQHSFNQVDIVPPGYANLPVPPNNDFQLTEETLSINPRNPDQLATTVWVYHLPLETLPVAMLYISNDGGQTWNFNDAFAGITLPAVPGYTPIAASNQQCIFDGNGNLFYTTLTVYLNNTTFETTLYEYVVMSGDGGNTWTLIDFITGIHPDTFGLDYPVLGTGGGPNGTFTTWLTIKQDISFAEIIHYGSTLPLLAAGYQTTGPGVLGSVTHQEVSGTEVGGFGNVAVGPDGEVLIVGMAVNNTMGSLPFSNTHIWTSFNKKGINGTFNGIKTIANPNTGYRVPYLPSVHRGTSTRPTGAIDQNGRWYVVYVDQPTPHFNAANSNVFLIYSDDHGKHWSSPLRINNDVDNVTFHIMPQLSVDPVTNDLAITWLDSREDETDYSTRLWGTVIKHKSLPRLF